ncbi:hypothetical protein EV647_2945 [Kribbella sp. VKM Ac-2566]|nr:hypothetical protein EV647_2945 [Kribbella sp. VKM Ac-2566]
MSASPRSHPTDRRVCVWFGTHLVADYVGDPDDAVAYESGMRGRFISLRISNEPAMPQAVASDRNQLRDGK